MSSYRPRTPPRSNFGISTDGTSSRGVSHDHQAPDVSPKATFVKPTYVPHVFDIVYPARDAVALSKKHIPQVFLEAETVDSSVLLGHGASFTASLQRIPAGPKSIEVTTHLQGWSTTSVRPAPPRPAFVVYKTARIAFEKTGEPLPQYRRAMQSVLTEFHALINPFLLKHPNVIDFLGIAWGSNPFSPLDRLPSLIVEYAEHGTLSQVLAKQKNLSYEDRHALCLDVTKGLSALHEVGFVHGDVKGDNVLVFTSPNRRFLAKISDFGFSILKITESTDVWMGGTDPWRAPEARAKPIKPEMAMKTDIYSLGLLIWLIALNGQSPFEFVAEGGLQNEDAEILKTNDGLLSEAKGDQWLHQYIISEQGASIEELYGKAAKNVSGRNDKPEIAHKHFTNLFPKIRDQLIAGIAARMRERKLIASLNDIFDSSLSIKPDSRDLETILVILESSIQSNPSLEAQQKENAKPSTESAGGVVDTNDRPNYIVQNDGDATKTVTIVSEGSSTKSDPENGQPHKDKMIAEWLQRGFKKHWFSWQKTRDLQPSVQNFVFGTFSGLGSGSTDGSAELFILSAYRMNGYGCKKDSHEALHLLEQAASLEHQQSRAFLYRVWDACCPGEPNPGKVYLETYAKAGSRPALADIERSFPEAEVQKIRRWITDASGGVGADWLGTSNMLNGYTQSQWIGDAWLMDKVRNFEKPLSQLVINKRGDNILHFVAMCGRWKPFKALILDHKMDVNLRNPLGETPLLAATRAGHGGIIIWCLQQFKADASLAAENGETPLHWLVNHDDAYIEPMVKDMIARGANVNAATRERVAHSMYPGSIDVDLQLPGTALDWAVHNNRPQIVRTLLKHGADPSTVTPGASLTAVANAAYYHHHECLKVIIDHLETKVTRTTSDDKIDKRYALMYGPVVMEAMRAADKFSMILRGRADYMNRLHKTLDLLREKTEFINISSSFQGSMLYSAASTAHDEFVEYMFEKSWYVETINTPMGEAGRTPVLEAMRWNRESLVQMLVDHGADIHALAANPFAPEESNWSALHIYAHEGHERDLCLVEKVVGWGVPVEGSSMLEDSTSLAQGFSKLSLDDKAQFRRNETPFAVAIRHNAFTLANVFLSLGADPNSLCLTSGLCATAYPTTVLGHLIVTNARYCHARLNYLLNLSGDHTVSFTVEPARSLTALHRCAMGYQDVMKRIDNGVMISKSEFDMDTSADIMYELLRKWNKPEELNAKCGINGSVALHLAVKAVNLSAVQSLVDAGASVYVENDRGETPLRLLDSFAERTPEVENIKTLLEKAQH